jgi:hypothetical protein
MNQKCLFQSNLTPETQFMSINFLLNKRKTQKSLQMSLSLSNQTKKTFRTSTTSLLAFCRFTAKKSLQPSPCPNQCRTNSKSTHLGSKAAMGSIIFPCKPKAPALFSLGQLKETDMLFNSKPLETPWQGLLSEPLVPLIFTPQLHCSLFWSILIGFLYLEAEITMISGGTCTPPLKEEATTSLRRTTRFLSFSTSNWAANGLT